MAVPSKAVSFTYVRRPKALYEYDAQTPLSVRSDSRQRRMAVWVSLAYAFRLSLVQWLSLPDLLAKVLDLQTMPAIKNKDE